MELHAKSLKLSSRSATTFSAVTVFRKFLKPVIADAQSVPPVLGPMMSNLFIFEQTFENLCYRHDKNRIDFRP
ncbi:hypothetical protein RJ640_021565 [Escallonia rubra]|uniref:Uncharacterized protein n=1 Tax=Escallonia rubra TaxID=112253 RepID=A0AA88RWN6_9ASTE|nr:hypothetical protein RJ640_021565 [Escallonia rubra]